MECEQAAMVGATQAESSQRELLAEGSEGGQQGRVVHSNSSCC
jgi:hypothetical protein